jgi:hypothetical protein
MARRNSISIVALMLPWIGGFLLSGCSNGPDARALFTRPELFTYERHAVLGLDPEQEQIFMAAYLKTFSSRLITFVERSRLREVISEQDLLKGRLDERKRAKIQQVLGVEALIMCEYYASEDGRQKKLRVRIVDSETGAIAGSVLIDAPGDFEGHARAAAEALKANLLSGRSKGPYSTGIPASRSARLGLNLRAGSGV